MKSCNLFIIAILLALICESFVLPALAENDEIPNEVGAKHAIEGKDRRRRKKKLTIAKEPLTEKLKETAKHAGKGILGAVGQAVTDQVVDKAAEKIFGGGEEK